MKGVPAAASILAFEPIQRVLAVASLDGRIKLFGAPGVEVLLQSPLHAPCKYLEFLNHGGQLINITTQNDIEVWNMENQEVVYSQKWEHDITAISVLQGTTYMYLGDDNGTVSVLQYEEISQQVTTLPYCVPAHITLGGLVRPGSSYAPSVVGILPQVDALFSRLVIAYGNGLIILWGLHETGVLAIRGGTEVQRKQLKDYTGSLDRPRTFTERVADSAINIGERFSSSTSPVRSASSEEEEDEKEICTICWACQSGSTVAAGYVDGDIWLWRFPTSSKEKLQGENSEPELPTVSGSPVRKIDLVPGKSMKMPVILLKWSASGKGGKGGNGHLFVYGGSDLGATQALTVLSLDGEASEKLQKLELPLHGPFADAAVLSRPGGNLSTPVAGILVLCSPGLLHIYDGAGIASQFSAPSEDSSSSSSLQPVPWQLPIRDAAVAKLFVVSNDLYTTIRPPQLPIDGKGPLPVLPAGTKWPITGGMRNNFKPSDNKIQHHSILLTGHNGGYVQVWDASAASVQLLCTVDAQTEKDPSPVSAIFMCDQTGLLAVGDQRGEVRIFKLHTEAQEVKCKILNGTTGGGTEVVSTVSAGFQCVAKVQVHEAAINTIVISKGLARLAAGDNSGLISLLDVPTLSLLFFGNWSGKAASIARLNFAHSQVFNQENPMPSSGTDSNVEERAASPASEPLVLYVANKDTTTAILDGSTGVCLDPGPRQLTNSSTMLCMELLDVSGGWITSLAGEPSPQQADSSAQTSEPDGNLSYLIRCSETSLQVISIPTDQKLGDTLQEVTLENPCCWASTFQGLSPDAMGIILLHQTGHLEIRSLPDLRILTETALIQCLSMQLDLNLNFLKTLTCATNSHTILIHEERELVHLSFLVEENDISLPDCRPRLFDKDLAAAAEAAMKYSTTLQRKKSMPQGFLGVLKSAIEQGSAAHPASELPKLFSSRPFTVPAVQPSNLSIKTDSLGLDIDLEIDDILIDLDDMDVKSSPSASGESTSSKLVLHRVKNSPKGKDVASEESTRMQLFGDDGKPRQRTAEEIKAAYGHPSKAVDATNVAAMARDKLMERGEKLQSLNQRTEEMQAGAENFASLAEQLAKKYEKRKWWEF